MRYHAFLYLVDKDGKHWNIFQTPKRFIFNSPKVGNFLIGQEDQPTRSVSLPRTMEVGIFANGYKLVQRERKVVLF